MRDLNRHYEANWGRSSQRVGWTRGPIHELPEGFGILVFPPQASRSYWIYATSGMSAGEENGLELHLFSPRQADELVELLTTVAHYHRTGARLGLYDTVNFGRPWLPGSTCSYGLLSLPYLDGPKLEWFTFGQARVRNLWLLPITKAEREFKVSRGVEALERLLEEKHLNYLDPYRESVVEAQDATRQ